MCKLVVLRDNFCGQKTVIKQVQNEIRDCKGRNTKKDGNEEVYCVIYFFGRETDSSTQFHISRSFNND